jgi:putative heme degradation protein
MVIGGQHEMPPLVEYLKDADRLAQEVVNAWGTNVQMGSAMAPAFKALVDQACLYRTARRLADNHRKFDVMSEQEATQEMALRYAFAEAYKAFYEKHAAAS